MKIGLALSGGGALGAAHIGVLEALEKSGITITRICGTSAGAIAGLLYATGGVRVLDAFLHELEARGMINASRAVLLKSKTRMFAEVRDVLRQHISVDDVAALPIPFSCIATNLATGALYHITSGDPVDAVMASSAYPGIFPVQQLHEQQLIDGGVTRNFPVDILRQYPDLDVVIGSCIPILAPLPSRQQRGHVGRLSAAIRSLDIMVQESNNQQCALCDFCFTPPVEGFKQYDLEHVHQIRQCGRIYARREIRALLALLQHKAAAGTSD